MGNKTKKTYGASRRGSKQRGPGRKRKLENNENVDVSPNPPSPTPTPTTQQDPRSLPSSQIVSSSTSSSDTGSTHSKDDQDEFVDCITGSTPSNDALPTAASTPTKSRPSSSSTLDLDADLQLPPLSCPWACPFVDDDDDLNQNEFEDNNGDASM